MLVSTLCYYQYYIRIMSVLLWAVSLLLFSTDKLLAGVMSVLLWAILLLLFSTDELLAGACRRSPGLRRAGKMNIPF